jgi:hypothetical protein
VNPNDIPVPAEDASDDIVAHREHGAALGRLFVVAGRLHRLAAAFDATGNDYVAGVLRVSASELCEISETCTAAMGRVVHARFVAAEQASYNMLHGMLAALTSSAGPRPSCCRSAEEP